MKILFFGDIVGQPGRDALKQILPVWKDKYNPDIVIANGENVAHGYGITKKTIDEIIEAGVDIITSGDHIFDQKEAVNLLENKSLPIIRPANFPPNTPGRGHLVIEVGTKKLLIINLIGRVFMRENYDDPFRKADEILEEAGDDANVIIVDSHTEATSEKVCLGWYLDGRVSAVLGTHTHIPTADCRILPQKTAYISDVGMVGVKDSSLGVDKDIAIKRFLTQIRTRLEIAEGPVEVNAVFIETGRDGKAEKIEHLSETIAF
ncbi:MAG: TIGR00282 family metallophosphoesterase [bacterium]